MEVERGVDLKTIDASVKNRLNWRWLESKDNEGCFLFMRMYERLLFLCGMPVALELLASLIIT